jgi:hypothetical protein
MFSDADTSRGKAPNLTAYNSSESLIRLGDAAEVKVRTFIVVRQKHEYCLAM